MTAYKNGAGAEATRTMEWRPYIDAEDAGVGEVWIGKVGDRSIIWTAQDVFTLRVHDGFTPGGHIVEGTGGGGTTETVAGTAPIVVTQPTTGNYVVRLNVSDDAGNAVETRSDGIFVPPGGGSGTTETVAGTFPIRVTEPTAGDYLVAVAISDDAGQQIVERVDGLYVPPTAASITYVGEEGVSVDLSEDPLIRTVSLEVSPAAGNQLSVTPTGAFVPAPPVPPAARTVSGGDASTVTLVAANYIVDVDVSPEAHGYLVINAGDALEVPPIQTIIIAAASVNLTAVMAGDLVLLTGAGTPVLVLQTQATASYITRQETTVVCYSPWTITVPTGVRLNNILGPATFNVEGLPDGVMFKRIGDNVWLGLGDARLP